MIVVSAEKAMASLGEEKIYSVEPDGTIRLANPFKSLYSVFKPEVSFREDKCTTYTPPNNLVVHFSAKRSTDQYSRNFFEFKRTDGVPSAQDCIVNEGIALSMFRHRECLLPSFRLEIKVTTPGQVRIYSLREKLELEVDLCDNITVYSLGVGVHNVSVPDLGIFYVYSENANISNLEVTACPPSCQLLAKPIVVLATRERTYEVAWSVKTILDGYWVGTYNYEPTPQWVSIANAIARTFKHYEIAIPALPIEGEDYNAFLSIVSRSPSDVSGVANMLIGRVVDGELRVLNNDAIGYLYLPGNTGVDRFPIPTFRKAFNAISRDVQVPEASLMYDDIEALARGLIIGTASITNTSYSYNVSSPSYPSTNIRLVWKITHVASAGDSASNYAITPYKRSGRWGYVTYKNEGKPIAHKAGTLKIGDSPDDVYIIIDEPVGDIVLGWQSASSDGKSEGDEFSGLWTGDVNYANKGNIHGNN